MERQAQVAVCGVVAGEVVVVLVDWVCSGVV